jgi:hypothetical protein
MLIPAIVATPEPTHWGPLLVPGLLSAVFGLLGVVVGGWIATRNQGKERRHRRYEEQLRFYAELLSVRMVIRAKSELRLRLSNMAHAAWQEEIRPASEQGPTQLRDELYARRSEDYDKLADYSDNQLRDELIPLYHKMLDYWTANMAQAEPSTQQHFSTFVDFVEIWDRFLKKTLPAAVIRQIAHEEKKLYPLYEDIEKQVERLRKELLK